MQTTRDSRRAAARPLTMLALVATLALPAVADARPGHFRHGEGAERWMEARDDRMIEFLELSDEQAVTWRALREEHSEAQRSRFEAADALRDEVREMMDAAAPDAEAVGRAMIAAHREMEAARAARDELRESLAELLTAEQRERFETLRDAREGFGFGRHERHERHYRSRSERDGRD